MNNDEIKGRIRELEKRKDMAQFQRKITTQLSTAIEYDVEIDAIDRRLESLQYDLLKSEFNHWLDKLSDIASTDNVIVEAKYYDGLHYMYTQMLSPEEAYTRYLDLVRRITAINEKG